MANNPYALKTICMAIADKRCIAIRRNDRTRLVAIEPHALYTNANKEIILDFYQPPITDFGTQQKGFWDSVAWKDISAIFWLNTTFEPRTGRGFNPDLEKYVAGLLAVVDTTEKPRQSRSLWKHLESSLDRFLGASTGSEKKH